MKLENKPMFQMWKQKSRLFFSLSLTKRERKKEEKKQKKNRTILVCMHRDVCMQKSNGRTVLF